MNDYCVPKDEFEWRDILLKCGCSKETIWGNPFSKNRRVWFSDWGRVLPASDAIFGPTSGISSSLLHAITCSEFVEKYRTDKPKAVDPHLSLEGRVRELELKDDLFVSIIQRLHALEIKSALFDDILKRLMVLENWVNKPLK